MFKDARAEAEEQIYEKLKIKIDESFELANYDWTLSEPEGRASDYIIDLVAFLQSTFLAFTNLPVRATLGAGVAFVFIEELLEYFFQTKVATTACAAACQHINKKLMYMILEDEDVRQISLGALKQLDLDLIQCERK